MICIVIVCYDRVIGLQRILQSLNEAEYCGDSVDLLISIDKGQKQNEIASIAETFVWKNGNKRVRCFEANQGLRSHILKCGDLAYDYDAVIVFEDDLGVSKGFYAYCRQVLDFYHDDERIAGISLYKHHTHPGLGLSFEPANDGSDVFLMQFAQSWGQCWSTSMWRNFRAWYEKNSDGEIAAANVPAYISSWNEKSWLKYFMKYIVDMDRYFVYPQISLTTNYSEMGEHAIETVNDYQVPMLEKPIQNYRLKRFEDCIRYDVFFEREDFEVKYKGTVIGQRVCFDLYADKSNWDDYQFLISTASRPYRVLHTWPLSLRPQEANCQTNDSGNDIFLYDVNHVGAAPHVQRYNHARYTIKSIHWKTTLLHGLRGFFRAALRKARNVLVFHRET